jgi:hypothetical protein
LVLSRRPWLGALVETVERSAVPSDAPLEVAVVDLTDSSPEASRFFLIWPLDSDAPRRFVDNVGGISWPYARFEIGDLGSEQRSVATCTVHILESPKGDRTVGAYGDERLDLVPDDGIEQVALLLQSCADVVGAGSVTFFNHDGTERSTVSLINPLTLPQERHELPRSS